MQELEVISNHSELDVNGIYRGPVFQQPVHRDPILVFQGVGQR